MPLKYVKGDATRPILDGESCLIVHVVNSVGGWGRGFVLALSKRWPQPEAAYRKWHAEGITEDGSFFELGNIQSVEVEPNLRVVNLLAQEGYGKNNRNKHQSNEPNATPPIRYVSLEQCLGKVAKLAQQTGASVHMPKIGCGLGGGSWEMIEPIIEKELSGLAVTVYEL